MARWPGSPLVLGKPLDWHEACTVLKIRVPTAISTPVTAAREVPYGVARTPTDGRELPGQSWIDVRGRLSTGQDAGLAVITDVKSGFDVTGADIGITAVRSPVYAWHEPRVLGPNDTTVHTDQGRQQFRYLLVPHDGTVPAGRLTRLADEVRAPLRPQLEGFHGGDYPQARSFGATSEANILLTVLKAAEDAPGTLAVVRAVEGDGVATTVRISLGLLRRSFEADFHAYEIKTFLIPADPEVPVSETSLLEWTDDQRAALARSEAGGG